MQLLTLVSLTRFLRSSIDRNAFFALATGFDLIQEVRRSFSWNRRLLVLSDSREIHTAVVGSPANLQRLRTFKKRFVQVIAWLLFRLYLYIITAWAVLWDTIALQPIFAKKLNTCPFIILENRQCLAFTRNKAVEGLNPRSKANSSMSFFTWSFLRQSSSCKMRTASQSNILEWDYQWINKARDFFHCILIRAGVSLARNRRSKRPGCICPALIACPTKLSPKVFQEDRGKYRALLFVHNSFLHFPPFFSLREVQPAVSEGKWTRFLSSQAVLCELPNGLLKSEGPSGPLISIGNGQLNGCSSCRKSNTIACINCQ